MVDFDPFLFRFTLSFAEVRIWCVHGFSGYFRVVFALSSSLSSSTNRALYVLSAALPLGALMYSAFASLGVVHAFAFSSYSFMVMLITGILLCSTLAGRNVQLVIHSSVLCVVFRYLSSGVIMSHANTAVKMASAARMMVSMSGYCQYSPSLCVQRSVLWSYAYHTYLPFFTCSTAQSVLYFASSACCSVTPW